MSDTPSRTEVAAQISAAEARSATQLATALGDLRIQISDIRIDVVREIGKVHEEIVRTDERLRSLEQSTRWTKITIIGSAATTGLVIIGVVVSVLVFGQAGFGYGVSARDMIHETVAEVLATQPHTPNTSTQR